MMQSTGCPAGIAGRSRGVRQVMPSTRSGPVGDAGS